MAQSPKVRTYDEAPEMSASAVADAVVERLSAERPDDFILVNFANGDMVGHTGDLQAAIRAIEAVDAAVGRVVDAAEKHGASLIVTADHGNAEQMRTADGGAHTAHTTYDVECILVDERLRGLASGTPERPAEGLAQDGRLADLMPTALALMGLEAPEPMTGKPLVAPQHA
jgi:2,3-bisphosphoglycerate-independent phosphoglycerate mutase